MPNGTQAPANAEGPTQHTQKAAGALAIRPDQTQWTGQQAAVLRQSGIDNQVASEELSAFLHLCQRTRLDPFSRQIYLIGRWNNQQKRKVYTPQTSIDGYRVIAHRAATEAGHALGYEDTLWCAKDGRWQDVWLSDAPPAAAKVTVIRNGMRFSAVARYSEYAQTNREGAPSGLWGKMPATMTAKCAEALALRMAFPHDLAGVYTAEEMAQADNPAPQEPYAVTQERPAPVPEPTPTPDQGPSPDAVLDQLYRQAVEQFLSQRPNLDAITQIRGAAEAHNVIDLDVAGPPPEKEQMAFRAFLDLLDAHAAAQQERDAA
ncbi:phage recombination protein Bet [Streptomyces nigrescens]|uniref:phage recombination protein Bet n=1 Tax=Streptomyces nigrescens TaxID=1920 RepID=UPI0036B4BE24